MPTPGPDSQRMTSHPLLHLPQAVVMTPSPRKRSKYPTWRVHSSPEIVSKLDSSMAAKTIIEIYQNYLSQCKHNFVCYNFFPPKGIFCFCLPKVICFGEIKFLEFLYSLDQLIFVLIIYLCNI